MLQFIQLRNLPLRKYEQLPVQFVRGALVATWILEQKLLVIVLSIIPGSCCLYGGNDLLFFGSKMFLLHFLRHTTDNRLLLWGMEEYGGAIFCMGRNESTLVTRQSMERTGAAIRALGV